MEAEMKEQLIKSVKNIKNKIKQIKLEEDDTNLRFKKVFKPITDNLETIIKSSDKDKPALNVSIGMSTKSPIEDLNSSSEYNQFSKNIHGDSSKTSEYFDYDSDNSTSNDVNDMLRSLDKEEFVDIYDSDINVPFGLRNENKQLMMGNRKVSIVSKSNASKLDKIYVVSIGDRNYELTSGLKELLIRNKPNLKAINEKDKVTYKEILNYTNAHKRGYHPYGQIKGDKSLKYGKIIKPLFDQGIKNKLKTGGYIPINKIYKSNTDYIYWDDPNELIERLKLLIASQNAGNTNHENEIISIIEELTEAGIIHLKEV